MRKTKQEKYVIDLDAVFDFILQEEPRKVDTNIEETVVPDSDGAIKISSKTTKETKSSDNSMHETLRYNFLQRMLDMFDDMGLEDDMSTPIIVTLGDELAYNTCVQYGFVKKI